MSHKLATIGDIAAKGFDNPVYAYRPHMLEKAARYFIDYFPGDILFAVKTNPEPTILKTLMELGINRFDVASLQEIETIHQLMPEAEQYFMHPVKSRRAIREAYARYGVKHFSLDSHDELQKILEETEHASDLVLHVRLSIPNNYAEMNLSEKFGVNLQDAPVLLHAVAQHAAKMGICFHVGSQCMHPDAYKMAISMAKRVMDEAGFLVHYFNVGGGFPSIYPGMTPPDMADYFAMIRQEFADIPGSEFMTLLGEPGRAIVAECMSLVVKVDLRKGNMLYINDGTYGSLFDAGTPKFIFPVKLIRANGNLSPDLAPFSFYGPTCDSLDFMKGPFYLPCDVQEGDYIEIGQMGAYGRSMVTGFNGFAPEAETITISDDPILSLYNAPAEEKIAA
jgi:ornithine decarboxylase